MNTMLSSKFYNVFCLNRLPINYSNAFRRHITTTKDSTISCRREVKLSRGLILGVYSIKNDSSKSLFNFTPTGQKYNRLSNSKLYRALLRSGPVPKVGETRVFYELDENFSTVAVVGLGEECNGYDDYEEMDLFKEIIRSASGSACKLLQNLHVDRIAVESFGHSESAAEGAALSTWMYQKLRNESNRIRTPIIELYDNCDISGWNIGLIKADAQNLARELTDTPANLMTPSTFSQDAVEILTKAGVNVEVNVEGWAQTMNMGSFLSVAKGSCEPPIFLEASYYGAGYDEQPIILIGKGVTFDSGGVCLKKPEDMQYMRGDMSGAAAIVATIRALSNLKLPLNIRGLVALCENMPGCNASKPGDLVTAMNDKSIVIEDTDCEGRLTMADALNYAHKFNPSLIIDVGTLTKDANRALGSAASAAFSNSDEMFEKIRLAGIHTGDRVWRLPLWEHFQNQVKNPIYGDLTNCGSGKGGGACKAAAFLNEFVPQCKWIHLDTCGVMRTDGKELPYLRRGMSGRPTRTLIEFISSLCCQECP